MKAVKPQQLKRFLINHYTAIIKDIAPEHYNIDKIGQTVKTDMAKIHDCLVNGIDIGGIGKCIVSVTLQQNKANGISFVWVDKSNQRHWYPIVHYQHLWK